MRIKMDNLAEKASRDNGFDLFDAVKKESYSLHKEKKAKNINDLVLDCQSNYTNEKFNYLLSLIYRTYDIHLKIVETTAGSNIKFLSEDDYFQLYSQVLWGCIQNYKPEEYGDFKNYFIMFFRVTFLEEKKSSYLKVKGHIKPENRKPQKIIVFDNFDDSLGKYSSENSTVENKVLMKDVLSCLDEYERELILFKYFSTDNGKPRSNQDVIKKFNITVSRFEYLRKKAFDKIRENYPNVLDDYMYGKGYNDKIIEFLPVKEEADVSSALEGFAS